MQRRIERVLVRLPNWLGDALLARPLLHALRAVCDPASVTWIAPPAVLELLTADSSGERLEPWPRETAARRALAARCRADRPDAALVLPPSFSSAWFARATGARLRIGYAGDARSLLLTRAEARPARGEMHLADEYVALGDALGATRVAVPVLPVTGAARDAARRALAGHGVPERWIVLGPGAIYGPAKRWSPERFAAVGRAFATRGLAVLVCGTAAERAACTAVADAVGERAVTLAGETDLPTQAALCAGAAVVACNDSGLAHLAAAVGAPTVVVFGSTSSAWTAPLGPRVRVVQHAPVCAPCFQRTCRIGYRCLDAVQAGEVTRECLAVAA